MQFVYNFNGDYSIKDILLMGEAIPKGYKWKLRKDYPEHN